MTLASNPAKIGVRCLLTAAEKKQASDSVRSVVGAAINLTSVWLTSFAAHTEVLALCCSGVGYAAQIIMNTIMYWAILRIGASSMLIVCKAC